MKQPIIECEECLTQREATPHEMDLILLKDVWCVPCGGTTTHKIVQEADNG